MRLFTALCLSLAVAGLTSGCTMMRNPLAARTDPQDAAIQRMTAELKARAEKGDIEGVRRLAAEIEARKKIDEDEADVIQLASHSAQTSQEEFDQLVNALAASAPSESKEQYRQAYRRMPASALRQALAEQELVRQAGQSRLNQNVYDQNLQGTMLAQATPAGQGAVSGLVASSAPSAPNPRGVQQGNLGSTDPWRTQGAASGGTAEVALSQTDARPQAGSAARLPDNVAVQQLPAEQTGVQTVSGQIPVQEVSAQPAPVESQNPFRQRSPEGNLPAIFPGDSGRNQTVIQSSATVPAQAAVPAGQGGVALTQQIITQTGPAGTSPQAASGRTVDYSSGDTIPMQMPGSSQPASQVIGTENQTASRRPGVLKRAEEGIRNVAKPLIEFAQGTDQPMEPDTVPASFPADAGAFLQTLENELLTAGPGETDREKLDYIRKHVRVRMLKLLNGNVNEAFEPIPNISPSEQEFWQQMIWALANYFDQDGHPDPGIRASETIQQLRQAIDRLGHSAELKIRSPSFCHRIVGYGNYKRFNEDRFKTGQPVLFYAEVENFHSVRNDPEGYRTVIQSTLEIYSADDSSHPVQTIPFDPTEDFSRALRRDYFLSFEFSIPPQLAPGDYALRLQIVDQQSRKVATSRVNFVVE